MTVTSVVGLAVALLALYHVSEPKCPGCGSRHSWIHPFGDLRQECGVCATTYDRDTRRFDMSRANPLWFIDEAGQRHAPRYAVRLFDAGRLSMPLQLHRYLRTRSPRQ